MSTPAAVVSASVARAFGGPDLIGRTITLPPDAQGPPGSFEVVGIVNDVEPILEDGRVHPIVYELLSQEARPRAGTVLVRGRGDRAALMTSVKAAILGADPSAEVSGITTLDAMAGQILYPRRLAAGILAGAAAVGLFLACIGLYGIVSYSVAQRTREFGIRAALGARRPGIVGLVLRDGGVVIGVGLTFGLVFGVIALRASAAVIRGLPVFDAVAFVTIPAVLVVVALLACLSPALRASRLDPAQVMRSE